jgi:hypothetical protein
VLKTPRGFEGTGDFSSRGLVTTCEREWNGPCEDALVIERTLCGARSGD